MSFARRRMEAQQAPPQPERDTRRCGAIGCPCRASVDAGAGWLCSFHAWAAPSLWPRITERLRENDWALGAMADLQGPAASWWRRYARELWLHEPRMQPRDDESRELYLMRMHADLQHRVGATTQPAPDRIAPMGEALGLTPPPNGLYLERVAALLARKVRETAP